MNFRTWALLGARAGDNDQVIALAEALGLPFDAKRLQYNELHFLGPRLLGCSLASLEDRSRKAISAEPPPDLTISTGHRSVPLVRALRRLSAGRTRSIHIGFPRVSPAHFDLVITTPQYDIADHPNLLRIPYALTRAATVPCDAADMSDAVALPTPCHLLIVGGPTLFWQLDAAKLLQTVHEMLAEAGSEGGSVLVATSARTPSSLRTKIATILSLSGVQTLLASPGDPPGYLSLLSAATSIRVTADSVSMISDAIWTGKPLALVPIAMSPLGQKIFDLHDRFYPNRHAYPQDLRFFWQELATMGIGERLAIPKTCRSDTMRSVRRRALQVIAPT